jgi:hypothetical protein
MSYVVSWSCVELPASRHCVLCRASTHDKGSAHGSDRFSGSDITVCPGAVLNWSCVDNFM